jgi:hypothetical protein
MEQSIRLLNEKQTSGMLAVSVAALRRWRREGRGPRFIKCEACVRYDLRELTRFLEANSSGTKRAADSRSAAEREARSDDAATRT